MAQIGTIYNYEAFVDYGVNIWCVNTSGANTPVYDSSSGMSNPARIYFYRNGYGFPSLGYINVTDGLQENPLYNCGIYTTTINGTSYMVVRLRRSEELYNSSGTYQRMLPSGMEMAIFEGSAGASNKHYLAIQWIKENGVWVRPVGSSYGFVDTGAREYACDTNWSIKHAYN